MQRAEDWFRQALKDLEQANSSRAEGRHDWACFAAQQAAEKAVKALHLRLGQEAGGEWLPGFCETFRLRLLTPCWTRPGCWTGTTFLPGTRTAILKVPRLNTMGNCRAKMLSVMPVRSLNSSVFRWPDLASVDRALRQWAETAALDRPDLVRIGYFGSYARGDWGVGSDVDVVLIVDAVAGPFESRSRAWDLTGLPVPADLLVYTAGEWEEMSGTRFGRQLRKETCWVYTRLS